MKFGYVPEPAKEVDVPASEAKADQPTIYPKLCIDGRDPAYKELSKNDPGQKITLLCTFNVATVGKSEDEKDYSSRVELELISAKKSKSENPFNSQN